MNLQSHYIYQPDFIPSELTMGGPSPFDNNGSVTHWGTDSKTRLYIRAPASITIRPTTLPKIQINVEKNRHLFRVYAKDNALFLYGDHSIDNDKTDTKIEILIPHQLEYLNVSLRKSHSFLDCKAVPFFMSLFVSSHSVARVKAHNLFLQSTKQPHIEATLVPLTEFKHGYSIDGDITLFSEGGGHLIHGAYHKGHFNLAGSSMVMDEATRTEKTVITTPKGDERNHYPCNKQSLVRKRSSNNGLKDISEIRKSYAKMLEECFIT